MPLKPKKNSIFAIFEHFSHQIKLSLKVAKIIFFENFFLQQVTFIYDCNIMQKKVGVARGRVTPSGPSPPPGRNKVAYWPVEIGLRGNVGEQLYQLHLQGIKFEVEKNSKGTYYYRSQFSFLVKSGNIHIFR